MAKFTPMRIAGAWLVESDVHLDSRGQFREWFRADEMRQYLGIDFIPAQANFSKSAKGVVRGIHFSKATEGQSKLITCVAGRILDVVVDLRPESLTFKQWVSVELCSDSGRSVFISHGLGHAFQSLEVDSCLSYLMSSKYAPNLEFEINPLDPEIAITWDLTEISMSQKDKLAPNVEDIILTRTL